MKKSVFLPLVLLGWAVLLAGAVACAPSPKVAVKIQPVDKINWRAITSEEVEAMIELDALDANYLYEGVTDDKARHSIMMRIILTEGNPAIFDVLVKHGADIDYHILVGDVRMTALDFAVYHGREDMVRRLLSLGATIGDGTHEEEEGAAAATIPTLHYAVAKADIAPSKRNAIIDLLLAHGANIDVLDKTREANLLVTTPLMAAISNGSRDPEHRQNYIGIVHHLAARGADVNIAPENSSSTPVSAAVVGRDATMLREVMALGGDVNLLSAGKAGCRMSPLIAFVIFGESMEVFDELIAAGADLDNKGADGANGAGCRDIVYWVGVRQSRKLDTYRPGGNFNSAEEWAAFGGEILLRIKALCKERRYEVCEQFG